MSGSFLMSLRRWFMNNVPEANRRLAEEYRKFLREMKRMDFKVEDLPEDLQESMLRLHQNALMVCWADRQEADRKKKLERAESKSRFTHQAGSDVS
jgi:hypothetical protein